MTECRTQNTSETISMSSDPAKVFGVKYAGRPPGNHGHVGRRHLQCLLTIY